MKFSEPPGLETILALTGAVALRRRTSPRDEVSPLPVPVNLIKLNGTRIAVRTTPKIGRNEQCPCGSGRKYKACCLRGTPVAAESAPSDIDPYDDAGEHFCVVCNKERGTHYEDDPDAPKELCAKVPVCDTCHTPGL